MERIKGFFQSFDMFAAPATLRAKGSSSVTRTSAGVISFVLFSYFAYIFISGMIKIFTFRYITTSQSFQKIPLSKLKVENFMFGVGNLKLDPQVFINQFDIKIIIRSTKQGIVQNTTMIPCKPQQWKQLGDDYLDQFKLHYLDRFLCPQFPEKLKIINSTIIQSSIYFEVYIEPSNSTNRTQFRQKLMQMQEYQNMKFNLFFLDQAVIPSQQQGVQYFVNINSFAYMSASKKHRTLIRISNFQITTDYSIIPIYQDLQVIKGTFIQDATLTDMDTSLQDENTKIKFELSNDQDTYYRRVGKIDQMFSYAGGLFALVIWFLAFFVSSFNQYRYELMVAQGVFNYDKDGHKIRQSEFSFLKYIKYSIYQWLHYYFCYKPNWRDCKQIEATLAEANSQMDVVSLFRKLQFLQMSMVHTMNQSQNLIIALTQPRTLSQVKQQRLTLQYYFAVIKGQPAATVIDALDGNAQRFLNLKKSPLKQQSKSIPYNELLQDQGSLKTSMIDQQQSIKQKLMQYLQLSNYQRVCNAIAKYPAALHQAKLIELTPELQKVERNLVRHFLNIPAYNRVKIMSNIPLKIIHRLCLRRQIMGNNHQGLQNKQSLQSQLS